MMDSFMNEVSYSPNKNVMETGFSLNLVSLIDNEKQRYFSSGEESNESLNAGSYSAFVSAGYGDPDTVSSGSPYY